MAGYHEVIAHQIESTGLGTFIGLGHMLAVVSGGRQHLCTGEQEQGSQTQQGEVHTGLITGHDLLNTKGSGQNTDDGDRQSHPLISGMGTLVDAHVLGSSGQTAGDTGLGFQLLNALAQDLAGVLSLGGQLVQITGSLLHVTLPQTLFSGLAVGGDLRQDLGDVGNHMVDIFLMLEAELSLFALVKLDDQIRHGAKGALSSEAALAHGNALEHTVHGLQRHIHTAIQENAVEIQRVLAHAAGAKATASLFVGSEGFLVQRNCAESCGC